MHAPGANSFVSSHAAHANPFAAQRSNAVTVIAGVGVLLLAMGVGVLIGRSGSAGKTSAAPQVISVSSTGTPTTAAGTESAATSFKDDWPSTKSGYTVQLQKLPETGTQASAVTSAKAAVTAKGAKQVGALKSSDFSSLTAGNYVIYSGVYTKKSEAEKALRGLKKSFPKASVVKVSNSESESSSSESGVGQTPSKPAPPSVVKNLRKGRSGQSYEQKSKNLPNVISTG